MLGQPVTTQQGQVLVELPPRQVQRAIQLAEPPVGAPESMSELILVDRDEAQGWQVRRDKRLDNVFEERCDWIRKYGRASQLAVDSDELSLTYDELHGAGAGDRIALLFDRRVDAYGGMLAVLKIGGAYVPLDPTSPSERTAYIIADARAKFELSRSQLRERVTHPESLRAANSELLYVDEATPLIAELSDRRLLPTERGGRPGRLAFIVHDTGLTGRPSGVAIDHPNNRNFVKAAAEVYGIRSSDRVYQGTSLSSGRAVEQIWVPWAIGATLVPEPTQLHGQQLHGFLARKRVTALCGTPTQLADVTSDLCDLRLLLLTGEPVPQDLLGRCHQPGRRVLRTYRPAAADVATTCAELQPDKPVTLGVPLPSYATAILDCDDPHRVLPHGETGEIGIAGVGLACGYLNRDDLPKQAFVEDFLDIPGNPSRRIFRTGDLGRVNTEGEIEYLGRIDQPVDIAGPRLAPVPPTRPPVARKPRTPSARLWIAS